MKIPVNGNMGFSLTSCLLPSLEFIMKSALFSALIALLPLTVFAQDAPVPPNLGDPGYYGQIDPVDNAPPPVVYSTPIVVQPTAVYYPPVYLRVPPMYYQNWPQYCGYYNACFYPVFFVQEGWYVNWYAPWYRRYYPYGRPGFSAHVYYNPHYGGGHHNEPHSGHEGHHDDHHR